MSTFNAISAKANATTAKPSKLNIRANRWRSLSVKRIADVLNMTVEEGLDFFQNIPRAATGLQTLLDVGLGYVKLGQTAPTLSGGEAQRVKLATELSKRATGKTLYLIDEPTTGLSFYDVHKLLDVLQRLVDKGNSVIAIGQSPHFVNDPVASFDLITISGLKHQYPLYYHRAIELLRPQGLLVATDVLWQGRVLNPDAYDDAFTQGIDLFNRQLVVDKRFIVSVLPIGDGMSIATKL